MSENQNNHKNMPESATEKITWPAILITSIGLAVFLLAVIIASIYAVEGLVTADRNAKIGGSGTRELNALKAEDAKILNEFRALENGMYRIPIDLAMELTIDGVSNNLSESSAPKADSSASDSLGAMLPSGTAKDSQGDEGEH